MFRTIGGVALTQATTDAIDLRVAAGRVVDHEFQPRDPRNSRLMFAPTARSLRAGEGYVAVYEARLPFVQVGITDRISIGGGTPLVFGEGPIRSGWRRRCNSSRATMPRSPRG